MIGLHLAAACKESRLSDSPLWGCAGDCRVEMFVKVHYGTVLGGQMCRHVVNASPKTVPQCTWQPCRPGLARNLKVANRTGLVVFAIWDFKLLKYLKTNLNFLINSPGPKALFHLIWQGQICTLNQDRNKCNTYRDCLQQGAHRCDRFWFIHILSYRFYPVRSQLETVLDF